MLGLRKQATNKSQTLEPLPNSIFSASQVHTRQRLSVTLPTASALLQVGLGLLT